MCEGLEHEIVLGVFCSSDDQVKVDELKEHLFKGGYLSKGDVWKDLREVHIFKRVVVPDLRGKNQRYQSQPLPVGMIHKHTRLCQESLYVDQTEYGNLFLHSP